MVGFQCFVSVVISLVYNSWHGMVWYQIVVFVFVPFSTLVDGTLGSGRVNMFIIIIALDRILVIILVFCFLDSRCTSVT